MWWVPSWGIDVLVAADVLLFTHTRSHKPLQPFAPSLAYPAGQSPHFMDPAVLMHLRLLSQPPLFFKHSFTSKHKVCVYQSVRAYQGVCVCVRVCVRE